jgi:hypothetical protein
MDISQLLFPAFAVIFMVAVATFVGWGRDVES